MTKWAEEKKASDLVVKVHSIWVEVTLLAAERKGGDLVGRIHLVWVEMTQ